MIAREIEPRDVTDLARRLARRPGFVWLDGDGSAQGRRSYLAIAPSARIEAAYGDPDPLAALAAIDVEDVPDALDVPRYVGFVAYDAAWSGVSGARHVRGPLPVLRFDRYDAVLELDHATGCARIVGDVRAVDALEAALSEPPGQLVSDAGEVHAEPEAMHARAIEAALEAIGRGDVYEVNLARRFETAFEGDALALFLAMRAASPVPFGAFLTGEDYAIASRSMERFLAWSPETRRLVTRPIKGTIGRADPSGDAAGEAALRADEKERAEHVMIVDLMRNDLGRVAEIGTVAVESLFEVEPYARLAHLVSTVACRTAKGTSLLDVLRATFPPGSVTGAPKRAAVQTIEALERHARGVYTGAVGFVSRRGALSLSVAIRTAVVAGGRATYFAGGGIVEASEVAREVAETDLKARVFTDAVARTRLP